MHHTSHECNKVVSVFKPNAYTVGAGNSDGIDIKGFAEALFIVDYGTAGTSLDFKVQESDDDGVADAYADVTNAAITQLTSGDELALIRLKANEHKRYLRGVLTRGGTEDAGVVCILSFPKNPPVTQVADETVNVDS